MDLKVANAAELESLLAGAYARGEKVAAFDLSRMNRVLEHKAEDMTATVEAGMTLTALQDALATHGQWLPVDPPNSQGLTIGALLATNPSGPRRFGYGVVRDYVIGLQAVLADGRLIHSGGKVVKNVAGYDLMKLFIGSHNSLGVIVQATFKVLPRPEAERLVQAKCESFEQADSLIESVLNSEVTPIVLDLHNLSPGDLRLSLVVGFSGTRDAVEWQISKAAELNLKEPATLDHERTFFAEAAPFRKASVPPSETIELVRSLNKAPFVARAGNGIIYHRGPAGPATSGGPESIACRLKNEFDPKNLLPFLIQDL